MDNLFLGAVTYTVVIGKFWYILRRSNMDCNIYFKISRSGYHGRVCRSIGFLFGLGLYGFFIRKNRKGVWLILHRLAAFSLIVLIAIHIVSMD